MSALYHVSGATVAFHECPHRLDAPDACAVNEREILDIELTLYKAIFRWILNCSVRSIR